MKFFYDLWKRIRNPLLIIIEDMIIVIALMTGWFIISNYIAFLSPDENLISVLFDQISGLGSLTLYVVFLLMSIYRIIKTRQ